MRPGFIRLGHAGFRPAFRGWEGGGPSPERSSPAPPGGQCPRGLTFVLEVEASGGHADVRLEVQVELVGRAVQQGGHRGPCRGAEGGSASHTHVLLRRRTHGDTCFPVHPLAPLTVTLHSPRVSALTLGGGRGQPVSLSGGRGRSPLCLPHNPGRWDMSLHLTPRFTVHGASRPAAL